MSITIFRSRDSYRIASPLAKCALCGIWDMALFQIHGRKKQRGGGQYFSYGTQCFQKSFLYIKITSVSSARARKKNAKKIFDSFVNESGRPGYKLKMKIVTLRKHPTVENAEFYVNNDVQFATNWLFQRDPPFSIFYIIYSFV